MLASLACRSMSTISRIVVWSAESIEGRGRRAMCCAENMGNANSSPNNNITHLLITMRPPQCEGTEIRLTELRNFGCWSSVENSPRCEICRDLASRFPSYARRSPEYADRSAPSFVCISAIATGHLHLLPLQLPNFSDLKR